MTSLIRCQRCGESYEPKMDYLGHGPEDCLKFVTRDRDELRDYITREGPEHLRTELASLRSLLFRTETERKMALDALSRVQRRCSELLEEVRALKCVVGAVGV